MSKVDVLAALDRWYAMTQAGVHGDVWEDEDVNILAVRAAIAELIQADSDLDELRELPVQREPVSGLQSRLAAAWARRRVALDGVRP